MNTPGSTPHISTLRFDCYAVACMWEPGAD